MKVSELSGALLDYWVACAEGWEIDPLRPGSELQIRIKAGLAQAAGYLHSQNGFAYALCGANRPYSYSPSTNWLVGGPIIEAAAIGWRNATPRPSVGSHKGLSSVDGQPWEAWYCDDGPEGGNVVYQHVQTGATMLEACMRAFIASKFGCEVPETQAA